MNEKSLSGTLNKYSYSRSLLDICCKLNGLRTDPCKLLVGCGRVSLLYHILLLYLASRSTVSALFFLCEIWSMKVKTNFVYDFYLVYVPVYVVHRATM